MDPKTPPSVPRFANCLGWFAVAMSLIVCFAIAPTQTIPGGWWSLSLLEYVDMVAGTLLATSTLMVVPLLLIVRWPRIGGTIFILIGGFLVFVTTFCHMGFISASLDSHHWDPVLKMHLFGFALLLTGFAFFHGRPQPRRLAMLLIAGVPVACLLVFSITSRWEVSRHYDDGITTARQVQGNGVELIWAPAGPGWPEQGRTNLDDIVKTVAHLTEDGLSVANSPQNIWRLPTVDEVVRSLTRNGQNAGGEWDAASGQPKYETTPDKESPLWQVHSPVTLW